MKRKTEDLQNEREKERKKSYKAFEREVILIITPNSLA